MRIFLKTEDEINLLRAASQLASYTLAVVGRHVVPEIALCCLREQCVSAVRHAVSVNSFSMREEFAPQVDLCFLVNGHSVDFTSESVVTLSEGDALTVDCWVCYGGQHSFAAFTFYVSDTLEASPHTLPVRKSLELAIEQAVAGHHLKNVTQVVKSFLGNDSGIVQDLLGHGIGRSRVERPLLRISSGLSDNLLLKSGMSLAIAPTVCFPSKVLEHTQGSSQSLFMRYGQTVVVRQGGAEILTSFENIQ